MAVFDERNEFVGIVTAQDLQEEVVGQILDEDQEPARPVVQRQPPGTVLIDGRALTEEVCDEIGLECETPDGVDTFGGLLLSRLGGSPARGRGAAFALDLHRERVRGLQHPVGRGEEHTRGGRLRERPPRRSAGAAPLLGV